MIVQKGKYGEKVIVTDHSEVKGKRRVGIGKNTMKMMKKAIAFGLGLNNAKGELLEFIQRKFDNHKTANMIRVYGHSVYVIKRTSYSYKLLTILDLPEYYHKFWDGYSRKYLQGGKNG